MNDAEFFSTLLITHIIQFSIVILIAAVIIRLTGRRWPHFAFLVCMVALVKSLMPPVFSSPTGVFSMNSSLAMSTQMDVATLSDKIRHSISPVRSSGIAAEMSPAIMVEASTPAMAPLMATVGNLPWLIILGTVWVMGVLYFSVRATWQIIRLRQLIRERRSAVPRIVNCMIQEIREELSIRRRVDVLVSESNDGPAIIGFIRPVLILPRVLVAHSTGQQLRPIIAHELVHARRGDAIWGVLQLCAEIVWWFHPFVWWLARRANMLCERCCDEEAIAGLRCSAADYAESLVRVVAMRNVFRPVPCGNSLSPTDVTGQRLERLMKRCGCFCERTPASTWIGMMGLAVLLLPGAAWGESEEVDGVKPPANINERINAAIKAENWDPAVKYLTMAVEADPDNADATFMLGYALHMQERYDDALEWHRKATAFEDYRATALYNWACVLSLTGDQAGALSKLEEALAAGFRHQTDIADDPDLAALLDSERFQELRTRARRQTGNDSKRAFDFWVGEWDVLDHDGRKLGVNVVTREENGHLLREKWNDARGSGSGSSWNFYDPADQLWHQNWVDSKGAVIRLKGGWRSDHMELSGVSVDANGAKKSIRISLTPKSNQHVLQRVEESLDDGETWTVTFDGYYKPRVKPKADQEADTVGVAAESRTLHYPQVDTLDE